MPPDFKLTFLLKSMSDESNSVIVWYEMLWRTIVLFPIFSLIQDLMKISFVYRWDQADFHSDYVTWLLHLSYYPYKNLVVTMPFWVWGPLGLASMQLRFCPESAYCFMFYIFVSVWMTRDKNFLFVSLNLDTCTVLEISTREKLANSKLHKVMTFETVQIYFLSHCCSGSLFPRSH